MDARTGRCSGRLQPSMYPRSRSSSTPGGTLEMDARQRADFLAFVHDDGKGFIGIHSTTITFTTWAAFVAAAHLANSICTLSFSLGPRSRYDQFDRLADFDAA